ncbi:hypothetical protein [Paenibacillus contaminans]|uniref:Uncharacterized protein n=1 Tax=Paenibacillus contaminans TaxID=450362 RepID=A0A329M9B4_9BACL|nr:hypothetical protein [Paenibacillus contaminans]RAV13617.1 hypothetical protein DQG23_33030 [Paenibacillus contaminans]
MIIFMEGLPGSGKSTNSGFLYRQFERNGLPSSWIHELERPHSVLFFHEACLTKEEFQSWPERFQPDLPLLHKLAQYRENSVGFDLLEIEWHYLDSLSEPTLNELRRRDVWNFTLKEYLNISLEKWKRFVTKAVEQPDRIYILDSCIFQYQVFAFLWDDAPKQALMDLVSSIWKLVMPLQPKLIYMYRHSVRDAIEHLRLVRGESFLQRMWERDRGRPYYAKRTQSIEAYCEFLHDYHELAVTLYEDAPCEKLAVEVTEGDWQAYEERMLRFFDLAFIPDPPKLLPIGKFHNEDLELSITIENIGNEYVLVDPFGAQRRLYPRSDDEAYIRDLPVILHVESNDKIITKGSQLTGRWTESGLIYKRVSI